VLWAIRAHERSTHRREWLIDHGCVELHAWRGYLRERLREYDGAITDYSYAIADDADKAPAAQYDLYLKRGHVYFAIKRYADALSDFTTAISFTDQAAELEAVHIWRGNTYIELGDRKAAAQAFKLAQAIANDKE